MSLDFFPHIPEFLQGGGNMEEYTPLNITWDLLDIVITHWANLGGREYVKNKRPCYIKTSNGIMQGANIGGVEHGLRCRFYSDISFFLEIIFFNLKEKSQIGE